MSLSLRDTCSDTNSFNGEYLNLRISSVFVILVASALGAFLPLIAAYNPYLQFPGWCFFITRYVGSGVIVATGFIHLLAEAQQALSDPCLGGVLSEYPWAEGIALMGVFLMFFFDIVAHKKVAERSRAKETEDDNYSIEECEVKQFNKVVQNSDNLDLTSLVGGEFTEKNMYEQILNAFVLEFGIVFHSVFVGLSLAIAGNEFISLYIAIAFHQMLEGLGLGTRFAMTKWPQDRQWVPWVLALCYSLTTPVAIAVGLGIRHTYPPGSRTALITTGVFDALCGGVLIYNSLVELMAYDFMYSSQFKDDVSMKRMFAAYICLLLGAAAMALIGKWA